MRIIKRPKFKKITCRVCGCVFVPSDKDVLTNNGNMLTVDKIATKCPVCCAMSFAEPVKKPPQPQPEVPKAHIDVEPQIIPMTNSDELIREMRRHEAARRHEEDEGTKL